MSTTQFDPDSFASSNVFCVRKTHSVSSAANVTWTAQQVLDGAIVRPTSGGNRTDTLPSAASIVALLQGINANVMAGATFECVVHNEGPGVLTVAAGTGITLSGDTQIPAGDVMQLRFIVVNLSSGSEDVVVLSLVPSEIGDTTSADFTYSFSPLPGVANVKAALDALALNQRRLILDPSGVHTGVPAGWSVSINTSSKAYVVTHNFGSTAYHADFIPIANECRYACLQEKGLNSFSIIVTDDDGINATFITPILLYVVKDLPTELLNPGF